jgi:hypothetical protein
MASMQIPARGVFIARQGGQDRMEAAKLGFRRFLIPTLNKPKQAIDNIGIMTIDRVDQAIRPLRHAV